MYYETADTKGKSEVIALCKEFRNLPADVVTVKDDWDTRICTLIYKDGHQETRSIDSMISSKNSIKPGNSRNMNDNEVKKHDQMTTNQATTAKPKAPAALTRAKNESNITKSFKDNANKCDELIKKFKARIVQIDRDIITLSAHGLKTENYDAIVNLQQEKKDLLARIEKLQQIRGECLKEAGEK